MSEQSFTFYTYTHSMPDENRWRNTGISDIFYADIETAKRELLELHSAAMADGSIEWPKTYLEKIETLPITKASLLALLNSNIGAILKSYEIVETIG